MIENRMKPAPPSHGIPARMCPIMLRMNTPALLITTRMIGVTRMIAR